MLVDDFDEWYGKYNIGDLFIDIFAVRPVVSYIFRIEYEPNSRITYYWLRHCEKGRVDVYFTEQELDEMLIEAGGEVEYYPVVRDE